MGALLGILLSAFSFSVCLCCRGSLFVNISVAMLSTTRVAQAILYMDNGSIKVVGTHELLMELDGKHAVFHNT